MAISLIPNPQITDSSHFTYATNTGFMQDSVGNLYYVTMAQFGQGDPTNQPSLVIYKSVDGGVVWTTVLSDEDAGSDDAYGCSMFADNIYICIRNASLAPNSHLGMFRFNIASGTLDIRDYSGPDGAFDGYMAQTVLTDGTIVIGYQSSTTGTSGFNDCALITWKSGVWGTRLLLGIADVTTYPTCCMWLIKEVGSERVHLMLFEGPESTSNGPGGIWHVSMLAGALGTLQNPKPVDVNIERLVGPIGQPCIVDGDLQIVVPYVFGIQNTANPSSSSLRVLRGTVAANPLWTDEEALAAGDITGTDIQPWIPNGYFAVTAIYVNGGVTIGLVVNNNDQTTGNDVQSSIYTVSTTELLAGWQPPVGVIDMPFPSATSSLYMTALDADHWGMVVGDIVVTGNATQYEDLSLFYITGGAEPPTEITVSVNTLTGCFSAVGGVPPYTFTVTDGTIPPGMVLNPTSGCVTGTPTTPGTYPFTVTATDSNDDTGDLPVVMTISVVAGGELIICSSICCFEQLGVIGQWNHLQTM